MCCVECSIIQAHFASECRVRVWYSVCGKTQPCCEGLHFASHWSTVDDEGLLHNGKPLRFKKHCGGEHIYVTCIPHSNLLPLSIRPNSIPIRTRKSSDRLSLDYRLQSMMTVCIYIYIYLSIYLQYKCLLLLYDRVLLFLLGLTLAQVQWCILLDKARGGWLFFAHSGSAYAPGNNIGSGKPPVCKGKW